MGQLTNLYVSESYQGLIKLANSTTGVTGTLQYTQDGVGNNLPIQISTSSVNISGSFTVNGAPVEFTNTGSFATTGSNTFIGNQIIDGNVDITGSLHSTDIIGTGSLFLQPNQSDARYLEIYNTSPTDTHITASGGQIFLGDDQTYVKVDNYGSVERIDIVAGNELNVSSSIVNLTGSLHQSGTFYPDVIDWFSSSIVQNTGSYVLTTDALGVTQYDSYQNVASALQPFINTGSIPSGTVSGSAQIAAFGYATTGSNVFQGLQTISGSLIVTGSITALSASITYLQTVFQTSSIIFSSGSNILGDEAGDTQTLNGQVNIPLGNLNVTGATTSSLGFFGNLQGTASYATQALSSSWSNASLSSSFAFQANTASYVLNSVSASQAQNAVTASFALNGGVTQLLAGSNITLSPISGKGQVTISSTGTGTGSFNTATGSYGSFYDTTIQTNPVANTPRSMSFNETAITNGVLISGSISPFNTYIKTIDAGTYNIQFSAQVEKTDSGTDEIDIWIRKNGIDLVDTATKLTLTNNNTKAVAAWNWFVQSATNDYYQLIWSSADTGMRLFAEPSSSLHPGIPSVIATANRVDQFLSNTGSFNGDFNGSFTGSLQGTASYATQALSASYAPDNSNRNGLITTGSIGGTQQITGSLGISGTTYLYGTTFLSGVNYFNKGNYFITEPAANPSFIGMASGSIIRYYGPENDDNSWISTAVNGSGDYVIVNSNGNTHIADLNTSSINFFAPVTSSVGFKGNLQGTASYATNALTASFALNGGGGSVDTGSFATTGSNTFKGTQNISGSLNMKPNSFLTLETGSTMRLIGDDTGGPANIGIFANSSTTRSFNIQAQPSGNGTVAFSDFPTNNHFMFFNMPLHWIQFEAPLTSTGSGNAIDVLYGMNIGMNQTSSGMGLKVTGSVNVTGSLNVTGGITGSLQGTASYATNALTASFALNGGGGSSNRDGLITTGSAVANQQITGSLGISGTTSLYGATFMSGVTYTNKSQYYITEPTGSPSFIGMVSGSVIRYYGPANDNNSWISNAVNAAGDYVIVNSNANTHIANFSTSSIKLFAPVTISGSLLGDTDNDGQIRIFSKNFNDGAVKMNISSSAPAASANIIFGNAGGAAAVTQTGSIVISGSNNIIMGGPRPNTLVTNGTYGYLGGNANIMMGQSTLTTSSILRPSMNNNILAGAGILGMTFTSSSFAGGQPLLNSNIVNSNFTINMGASGSISATGNIINGAASLFQTGSAIANARNTFISNNINSSFFVQNYQSSSFTVSNNNTVGASHFIDNNFVNTFGTAGITVSRNFFQGQLNYLNICGSPSSNLTRTVGDSFLGGYNVTGSLLASGTNNGNLSATLIYGNNLNINGTSVTNVGGNAFFGRYNDTGSLANSNDIVMAVGTGTAVSTRRTGFYITTGSLVGISGSLDVKGNTTITGSVVLSGSVGPELIVVGDTVISGSAYGVVNNLSISSNTASLNLNSGNFFTLSLPTGVDTFVSASNIQPGQTVNIVVSNGGTGTISFSNNIKQPSGSFYTATTGSGVIDVVSLISVDTNNLYMNNLKNLI